MNTTFATHAGRFAALTLALALVTQTGCQRSENTTPGGGANAPATPAAKTTIQNAGSDTMVNLAQAWAEEYAKVKSDVSVEVSGGGSGTGIAGLINGTVEVANASRKLETNEAAKAVQNTGKEPQEFMVGYDALGIYVHKNNPLDEISLEQLAQIFGEGGTTTKWTQLNVTVPNCPNDEIVLVSRQNNSGTYHYFREHVLKKKDFKLGTKDMHGSKDVVELISKTPGAIGYSGMGYATPEVKMLRVSKKTGDKAYPPTIATTLDGTYPISRPLFMYTAGTPAPHTKAYLDWILSSAGQKIVEQTGYVPLPKK
jgi:phosphate transport system substrate-binding protein